VLHFDLFLCLSLKLDYLSNFVVLTFVFFSEFVALNKFLLKVLEIFFSSNSFPFHKPNWFFKFCSIYSCHLQVQQAFSDLER
jgi:hypothetical protein